MMISNLPQDLIEEILSRVPVTSLRRLRSTCKRWYHETLFKDRRFIKKHFDKTARQYHALVTINFKVCSLSSIIDSTRSWIFPGGINLPVPHCDEHVNVSQAFHCDGILLCNHITANVNMLVVWNPFSGQTRWIQVQKHYKRDYALGYDNGELCRSYKILRFPCRYDYENMESWKNLDVTPEDDLKCEIYEFSSNSWRNLDAIIPDQTYLKPCGVSLKGNTYWVSCNQKRDNNYSLLCFDFSTEKFQRLCAPFHHEPCHFDTMALSVVREEHLSLLYQSKETLKVEIWMTNEIETTFVSWSKFLTVDLKHHHCFSENMSFFITDKEKKVVVCSDRKRNFNYCMVWIVGREEEYRATPNNSVCKGIEVWGLPYMFAYAPRLFGYVPKLEL